jgi:hypothetical protein
VSLTPSSSPSLRSLALATKYQVRVPTGRVVTPGTATCDFKGPFAPAKDGGETSVLGFKHPTSGYVHEVYLTRQTVDAAIEAFDEFADIMRVRFTSR